MSVQLEVGDIIWSKIDGPSAHRWVVASVQPCESIHHNEMWEIGLPYGPSDVVIQSLSGTLKRNISALIEAPNHWAVKRNGKVIQ